MQNKPPWAVSVFVTRDDNNLDGLNNLPPRVAAGLTQESCVLTCSATIPAIAVTLNDPSASAGAHSHTHSDTHRRWC